MPLIALIPFAAAGLAFLVAVASLVRKAASAATWSFSIGMLLLATDSLATGFALRAQTVGDLRAWLGLGLLAKACLPAVWLAFGLTYARSDARSALSGWWLPLTLVAVVPLVTALVAPSQMFHLIAPLETGGLIRVRSESPSRLFHGALLVGFVLAMMNLEQTFRGAVGTMRWRIKYVVLGLGIIFGAYIFVRTQAILYSAYDPLLAGIESSALLVGAVFLVIAYARNGLGGLDVYPSRAVLRSSLTVIFVGGYLFAVGVLAQLVRRFGGAESFQFQALLILVALGGLAVLLLSDRLRQRIQSLVGRHFSKAQHDSVRVWTESSRQLASVRDRQGLSAAIVKLVSETFDALSVSVWLVDGGGDTLVRTAASATGIEGIGPAPPDGTGITFAGLHACLAPFDLDDQGESWADALRRQNPSTFTQGGHRWCVPLRASERVVGVIVLADRVNGTPYTVEERDLLQCMADQMASVLVNLRLSDEIARGRELQAFQTMSAFFVHDLKNAAASLNLMLKNLPVHFDDPAFRADALRAIGNTARRIDEMIGRLGAFRQRPFVAPAETDLSVIVRDAVDRLDGVSDGELGVHLEPGLVIQADPEQVVSVVANLLLNARDATDVGRRIEVRTAYRDGRAVLTVVDNGCGMSPEFLRDSLFRPFKSTKTKGLGIGMFQSRMIVEAHGGRIDVESHVGAGTTLLVSFPEVRRP